MNIIKCIFTIFLVLFSLNTSFSGTISPYTSDQKHIEYGKDFRCVGKLCGVYKDGSKFCASAVAIDDNFILTAAHVVENAGICFVTFEDKKYCIAQIIIHKDFNYKKYGTADIAIGYCKESFNLNFYPKLYSENNENNKICCIAGYGFYGTFNSGAKYYDNQKRAGSNKIDHIEKDLLICSPSTLGDKNRTSLEFLIASGDSGGGLFIDNKLAGINSCVMAIGKIPMSKYGEESGHTRISNFVEWINETKQKMD